MSAPTYVELFAGAGGLSHGLDRAGWHCLAHAEIELHARAVLRHHWPDTPLFGDVSTLDGTQWRGVTLLSGGSPCQDLSVAGKRAGLRGRRSGLFFHQVRLWHESQATYCLWENVVGALSSREGKDFARVLSNFVGEPVAVPRDGKRRRGKWSKAESLVGSTGVRVAWRVIDLRGFAVPQRRRRVFVLAARAGAAGPAEVLLELEGDKGHRAAGGEAREADSRAAGGRVGGGDGGKVGAVAVNVSDGAVRLDADMGALGTRSGGQEVGAQTRGVVMSLDAECNPGINQLGPLDTGSASGEGGLLAAVTFDARGNGDGATVNTLAGDHANRVTDYTPLVQQAIGFHATQDPISGSDVPALGANSGGNGVLQPVTAFKVRGGVERDVNGNSGGKGYLGAEGERFTLGTAQDQFVSAPPVETPTLTMGAHPAAPGLNGQDALQFADAMLRAQGGPGAGPLPYHPRRLMPVECERLMSWPDGWTERGIDEQGREYALSDTARYKLCGNGVASVVSAWIGLRLRNAIEAAQ